MKHDEVIEELQILRALEKHRFESAETPTVQALDYAIAELSELDSLKSDIADALNTINKYAAAAEVKDVLLKEAATDLEEYISAEHLYREQNRSEMLKYHCDMDIVHRIRKELVK